MSTPYDYYSAVEDYYGLKGYEGAVLERQAGKVCAELEKVFAEGEAARAAKHDNFRTVIEGRRRR